ncbi:MAG: NADH:ubiquinone reductase (Na(+)-transporting) subunit D, partial [Gammaproteobacteria bacterium]|nr:NADH:ubiquinone reductase (Na(+)-transporting) subunit D [Gammaproteobacteria bacterium]
MSTMREALTKPIIQNNPIALQILGICSALAVTSSLKVTLVMCISVTLVTAFSSFAVSLIRNQIPGSIRIIVQ